MIDSWDRRRFVKRMACACAGVAGTTTAGVLLMDEGRKLRPEPGRIGQVRDFRAGAQGGESGVSIGRGDPAGATRRAIEALGGMKSFVAPGESVVLKPNIGWDRTPVQAANTNPIVVETVARMCFEAGASSVVVTDHSCNEAARCFTRSGIWKAAESAGAQVVLPAPHRFRPYDLGGVVLGRMPVLAPSITADRFINLPIAKHHGLSGFTGAMKNLYGILGGRRNRLHQRINESIADLADFVRPTLTVMDATRVLFRNGPQGGDLGDTKEIGQIIASRDQVAVDAYSCGLLDINPHQLPYIAMARRRGLGSTEFTPIEAGEAKR